MAAARQIPNPEIDINSESYPLFGSHPGPFLNKQELSFRAGQTIETAGKRKKRVSVARQEVVIARAGVDNTVRQLKLELKRRYYGLVLAQAQTELAQRMLDQFDQIIRLTEARHMQGEISGLEASRMKAERVRFFNDLIDAQLQARNARSGLLEIMGIPDLTTSFEVQEKLVFEPLPAGLEELRQEALKSRPDLMAARSGVERSARQLDLEHANAVPNMTVSFGYKRDQGVNTPVAGISMPLPLFNRNKPGVARAAAEMQQQKLEVGRVSLAVAREVQDAWQSLNAQAEKVKALQSEYVPSAEHAREVAQKSYQLGALDLIGLLDSERVYRETLRTYNQALYDYKAAIFELEAAVGKEF
jgi:cobalt-zinc-cadmium efflux system outer membrane protein